VLGAPELDARLQVGSDESGVKGQNHLPCPAGHTALDATKEPRRVFLNAEILKT